MNVDEAMRIIDSHLFDLKGTVSFTKDYHSGTWIGVRIGKREKLIASTADEEGEGQYAIEQCIIELAGKIRSIQDADP